MDADPCNEVTPSVHLPPIPVTREQREKCRRDSEAEYKAMHRRIAEQRKQLEWLQECVVTMRKKADERQSNSARRTRRQIMNLYREINTLREKQGIAPYVLK